MQAGCHLHAIIESPVLLHETRLPVRSMRTRQRTILTFGPTLHRASALIATNLKLLFMLQRTFRRNQFAILNLVTRR